MQLFNLIATCGAGIEALVARELKDLGYETQTENGRVRFKGTAYDIAKTNLWLRTADRIKIVFGEFKAMSFEELFDQTYALPWENLLTMDAQFPVAGRSIQSKLHSVPNMQRIVKRAIAKKMMNFYHRRANLPESGTLYPIEVIIRKNKVMLTVDTSGESLFKRGYRVDKGGAPLKENMAAALIKLTTWYPDRPLYDPTCGSGTILIEAALIAQNIAPGFNREFAAEHWLTLPQEVWQQVRDEAEQEADYDIKLDLFGTDVDQNMIEIAKANALEAGVLHNIEFKQMNLADYKPEKEHGILIANPPYGDRLLDKKKAHELYQTMGELYSQMPTWSKYILTSDDHFEEYYGQKATRKRKLYNGPIRTTYYQYWANKGR